jgi:hypothetical protein
MVQNAYPGAPLYESDVGFGTPATEGVLGPALEEGEGPADTEAPADPFTEDDPLSEHDVEPDSPQAPMVLGPAQPAQGFDVGIETVGLVVAVMAVLVGLAGLGSD